MREKIEAYDQIKNIAGLAMPAYQNRIVTLESNRRKKPWYFNAKPGGGALGAPKTTIDHIDIIMFFMTGDGKCITICIANCIPEFWSNEHTESATLIA